MSVGRSCSGLRCRSSASRFTISSAIVLRLVGKACYAGPALRVGAGGQAGDGRRPVVPPGNQNAPPPCRRTISGRSNASHGAAASDYVLPSSGVRLAGPARRLATGVGEHSCSSEPAGDRPCYGSGAPRSTWQRVGGPWLRPAGEEDICPERCRRSTCGRRLRAWGGQPPRLRASSLPQSPLR